LHKVKAHHIPGIAERRLYAIDPVRWLGAVQSQDYAGAKWALEQRSRGLTAAKFDRLFDQGAILRTTSCARPGISWFLRTSAGCWISPGTRFV